MARSAGAGAVYSAREGDYALLVLPSTENRKVRLDCRCTVGQVGNVDANLVSLGKAGRSRHRGIKPHVRGSAMNPVSHPMGGGEGRRAGGRHPVSKWGVLKGWHVFRHSFISALASKGVDQRIIDDLVGHATEEQRRRYRHLFPDVKQQALLGVFG